MTKMSQRMSYSSKESVAKEKAETMYFKWQSKDKCVLQDYLNRLISAKS